MSIAKKFKKDYPHEYNRAYEKTLIDAFSGNPSNEDFKRLDMKRCPCCNQPSAFFYGADCWRCFYAKEFYENQQEQNRRGEYEMTEFEDNSLVEVTNLLNSTSHS